MDKAPFFSIIISTRDRPDLFRTALHSVLEQSFSDREIVVVIDGSTDSNLARYRNLENEYPGVIFVELEHRPNGHGQSYAMNCGVDKSSGQYLCFLDDDDHWIDTLHLEHVYNSITAAAMPVDVHYSHQRATFSTGEEQKHSVWIEDLIDKVTPESKNAEDSYFVDADFLLSSGGFAHLNCSIFERHFYSSLGGMDESIRYENDRDIYIRSIDTASTILMSTRYSSRHIIPDVSKKTNMSTVSSEIEKKIYQMRVYDKGISQCKQEKVVRLCCKAKVYELKHAANILARNKQYRGAAHYAKAALISGFNLRWLAYTLYLMIKAQLNPFDTSNSSPK
jgi:glycosyltransferase involved in cell wall biosynthesis